ncbi:unnamed protein product [Miscanthus lutarioriparius]|uniref:Uncharacterized protein n=1 Tax=Miscanthus lutarioriparius TaxID=422564 RepID=A0A811PUD5_9POAL|nr:unnamed protein product [Miscanthus lutarioriparius]
MQECENSFRNSNNIRVPGNGFLMVIVKQATAGCRPAREAASHRNSSNNTLATQASQLPTSAHQNFCHFLCASNGRTLCHAAASRIYGRPPADHGRWGRSVEPQRVIEKLVVSSISPEVSA